VSNAQSARGRYDVQRLIEVYGRNGNMSKWLSDLKGDCPKRDVHSLHERCDLLCPEQFRSPQCCGRANIGGDEARMFENIAWCAFGQRSSVIEHVDAVG
jgi:hypothetical protein